MLFRGETYDKKHLLIDIVLSSISFVLLILSAVAIYRYDITDNIIDDILTNWNATFISDITEKTTNECNVGESEFTLGRFQGTFEGCNCLGRSGNKISNKYKDKVNPFPCTSDLLESNCYKTLPITPKTLRIWETKELCVTKTDKRFYDHIRESVSNNETCPSGTKQCGLIDSLNQKLCVLTANACPVNKIVITKYSKPIDDTVNSYSEISLNGSYNLYYSKLAANNGIPVEYTLSEGERCVDPKEINSKFVPYVLSNEKKDYYCSTYNKTLTYDDRYLKLDSMETRQFLDQNGLLTPLLNLPQYPIQQLESVTSLFSRTYIGWNITCLGNNKTNPEFLRNVNGTISVVYFVNICLCFAVALAFVYTLLISLFYKRLFPQKVLNINITYGISILLYLIILAISIFGIIVMTSIDFNIFSCGDTITSYFFNSLFIKLIYILIVYLILVVSTLGFIATYIAILVIAAVNNKSTPDSNNLKDNNALPLKDKTLIDGNKVGIEDLDMLKRTGEDFSSARFTPKEPDMYRRIGSKFMTNGTKQPSEIEDDKWKSKRDPKAELNIVEYK